MSQHSARFVDSVRPFVNTVSVHPHERAVNRVAPSTRADREPSFRTMVFDTLHDPALALWAFYILLFPVYVFRNGVPQPGDLLLIPLAPLVLARWDGRLPRRQRLVVRSLIHFVVWVVVVNIAWSAAENTWTFDLKLSYGLSPFIYVFNALAFLIALVMYQQYQERFTHYTVRLALVSVVVQCVISFFHAGGEARGLVLFNNANQLGYFAILSALIVLLGQKRARIGATVSTIALVASGYLALLSSSKAALGSVAVILMFGWFERLRTVLLTCLVSLLLLAVADPLMHLVDRASNRIDKGDDLSFVEERGYDRIARYPEHWLLGAGEGHYKRYWTPQQGAHEIHSSGGTIFFCYGVVGSVLFLIFAFRLFAGAPIRRMLLLAPAVAFGLSHQGMRSTLMWIMLALFVVLKEPEPTPRLAGT